MDNERQLVHHCRVGAGVSDSYSEFVTLPEGSEVKRERKSTATAPVAGVLVQVPRASGMAA
jgi:hypothetical protein